MFGRPIDEKIAKLSLDNEQFERNAKNSIKTFNEMNKSFSKSGSVDLSGIENSVNSISNRFTMLGNLGQAAFQRVANSVLNLGSQLNNTFGLGGALAGFSEYELKLGSIQTIMVNTGESIGNVSSALDELNHYADQTVYSFSDMTKNIGLFTAAGVDLKTSVSSIKGLANLAAGMGVSNESAARATWQLSQALGSGKVRLQDWMSVENAGLGGQYFQKALVEHANKVGTLSMSYEQLTKKYGTFRDSLTKTGWLTTDVLTATLDDFANDKSLQSAATELKSFTQLVDTVKESVGSGWAQTWEILFGNLEEAKKFWTPIGTTITDFIGKSNDARNQFLKQWKELGGLQSTFNGIGNVLTGLGKILKIVGDGFKQLIPDVTPQRAAEIAKSFEEITAKFAALDFSGFSEGVSNTFGLISKGLSGVVSALTSFSGLFNGIKTVVGTVFGFIGNAIGKLLSFASENLTFSNIFAGLAGGGIFLAAKKIADVFNTIYDALDKFLGGGEEKVSSIKDSVTSLLDGVGESLKAFTTGIKATTLLTLAAAVGILTVSISAVSPF